MNNLIPLYKQAFNLQKATFFAIEHEDAMVAIVYKVVFPNGKSLILKICPRAEDYAREVYFLKVFAELLTVPKIIKVSPPSSSMHGAILMESLKGQVLKQTDLNDKLVYEIGSWLACIHLNRVESYGDLTQTQHLFTDPCTPFNFKFEESFAECKDHLPQDILEKAHRYYDKHISLLSSVDGPCIIHRDFRPGNIMAFKDKLTGIIDWASARASFAEEDFCPLELGEWSTNSRLKNSFLNGYASVRPIPDYKPIMPLMCMSRAFATVGFTIKRGTWNGVNASVYQINRSYLEALANELMQPNASH